MFSTLWEREENREREKPKRKFSLLGPQISSPQIGRKSLSGKLMKSTFTQMPSRSQQSQPLNKEERRQFSNHQLSTTQLSPPQPKNNSKSNPISTENQLKIKPNIHRKSTQNQTLMFQSSSSSSSSSSSLFLVAFELSKKKKNAET